MSVPAPPAGPRLHEVPEDRAEQPLPEKALPEEPAGYRVDVEPYFGPVDLLHHLARRHEVDVLDVPMAAVAAGFRTHLDARDRPDLDEAGEFVSTTGHLVEMKARRAVPKAKVERAEAEPEDRTEVVRRLLEYRRYRDAAAALERRATGALGRYPRQVEKPTRGDDLRHRIRDVEVWDLVGALGRLAEPPGGEATASVRREEVSVADWVERMAARVLAEGPVRLRSFVPDAADRGAVVGAFLAVLELVRHRRFRVEQPPGGGEIVLHPPATAEPADAVGQAVPDAVGQAVPDAVGQAVPDANE